jgi:zinc protease
LARADQVNSSNHHSAGDDGGWPNLNLEAMRSFYNARFGNAADFTYFFVGAFTEGEITPLLEKWVASLPSAGKKTSEARDMGVKFPAAVVKDGVNKGKEPASQTLLSFFADPGFDEFEMHRARAAASVLNIRLREILREELGGTYGVSVGFTNSPPIKGYGAMQIQSRQLAGQPRQARRGQPQGVERLKAEGPSADDVSKVKELERRDLRPTPSRIRTGSARCRPSISTAGTRPASPVAASAQSGSRRKTSRRCSTKAFRWIVTRW